MAAVQTCRPSVPVRPLCPSPTLPAFGNHVHCTVGNRCESKLAGRANDAKNQRDDQKPESVLLCGRDLRGANGASKKSRQDAGLPRARSPGRSIRVRSSVYRVRSIGFRCVRKGRFRKGRRRSDSSKHVGAKAASFSGCTGRERTGTVSAGLRLLPRPGCCRR